ncbi:DEAD/DEAH box helicase [Candidatus Halobonum tyrrellensis]|uniref:ATP-dependent DNA helicase Hel308 n=1 Tax=Candidatus Halobonum tyrrellensis G22 TaxID=1324957 RepID=V4GTQ7_9EURY|nr:DEAD/DEAH box helicase [Candidatus Halobonum tyrrellensis]ESP88501.1 ATP-dependent DNA helicase [Candidatus Halobonum tyrrellensis G22]
MRVSDLPLDTAHVEHFEAAGIEELYPPQADSVEAGVCAGENVVAAIPTASGKTFVAELALLTAGGPGLYICPLRALAREKYEEFDALPGVDVGISTGDYDSAAADLAGHDVVVATSEKVDSAIRNGAAWVDDLACVVVDEVHLLGATGRGPTLEVTLSTLRRRTRGAQVVALSATVANPDEIAGWLDAELVESTWRPVDLRTGVCAGGHVAFDDGTGFSVEVLDAADPDVDARTEATAALVADAVAGGGQALAFVRSRREAEALADRLTDEGLAEAADMGMPAAETAEAVREAGGTETGERLAECAAWGVAFHHAGLRSAHRAVVERAFRERRLAVICATPTLAAGVNVPARRVVVRDQQRYDGEGMEWLPVLEVHQMCGRAGRPGLDPYGEAVLVGDDDERAELEERYVDADPEAVESKLRDRAALRTHTLALVATGFASSQAEVLDVLGDTFYAYRTRDPDLGGVVGDVVGELIEMGMLAPAGGGRANGGIEATPLGAQVSRQYVTPETGARLVAGLRRMAAMDERDVTPLTAFEVVCDTPDIQNGYLRGEERAAMYQFARTHADELTTSMGDTDEFESWLEAVKTARVLADWVEGESLDDLVEAYRIGPGDLESSVERAEWLSGAAAALAETLDLELPVFESVRARL